MTVVRPESLSDSCFLELILQAGMSDHYGRPGPPGIDLVIGENRVPALIQHPQVVHDLADRFVNRRGEDGFASMTADDRNVSPLQLDQVQDAIRADERDVEFQAGGDPASQGLSDVLPAE